MFEITVTFPDDGVGCQRPGAGYQVDDEEKAKAQCACWMRQGAKEATYREILPYQVNLWGSDPEEDNDDCERAREAAEERQERAMQAGMGLGTEAYNDEMGW